MPLDVFSPVTSHCPYPLSLSPEWLMFSTLRGGGQLYPLTVTLCGFLQDTLMCTISDLPCFTTWLCDLVVHYRRSSFPVTASQRQSRFSSTYATAERQGPRVGLLVSSLWRFTEAQRDRGYLEDICKRMCWWVSGRTHLDHNAITPWKDTRVRLLEEESS